MGDDPNRHREGTTATPEPEYCPIHQHYKWCNHNGGVLTPRGYRSPIVGKVAVVTDSRPSGRNDHGNCGDYST